MAKYMTPEDVAEEKASKKAEKAYNKAMPEADTTFGELADYHKRGKLGFTRAEVDKIRAGEKFTSAETKGGAALMYRNPMGKKMASGGTASSRADGCAQRGKTRGTIIK
jgi:hypothetical protein